MLKTIALATQTITEIRFVVNIALSVRVGFLRHPTIGNDTGVSYFYASAYCYSKYFTLSLASLAS